MWRLCAAVLLSALTACASNVGCGHCAIDVPPAADFASIERGAALREQLRDVLAALASCDAASPAIARAGLESPEQSGQKPVTHAMQCLRVVRTTRETPTVVSFMLAPLRTNGRAGEAEFVMFASRAGERWRFAWPAALGPPRIH